MAIQVSSNGRTVAKTETVAIGAGTRFYEVLSQAPATAGELASRTHTPVTFVREWLTAQVGDDYIVFDPRTGRYANFCSLPLAA